MDKIVTQNIEKFKKLREEDLVSFASKYHCEIPNTFHKNERIKLCSSDDFNGVSEEYKRKFDEKAPVILSHVGGFYVTASLAGYSANKGKKTEKPTVIFFDRKGNNVQNAIYNTLLLKCSESKEKYICNLFGLNDCDIVKALNPEIYFSYVKETLSSEISDFFGPDAKISQKLMNQKLKELYKISEDEIDEKIIKKYLSSKKVSDIIESDFNYQRIVKYSKSHKYDPEKHFEILRNASKDKLRGKVRDTFLNVARSMTNYLTNDQNYSDLIKYLSKDLKLNGRNHILANDKIFEGFKTLINRNGCGNIKFLNNIDINTQKGISQLKTILEEEGVIDEKNDNSFPIDVAFMPHIYNLKTAFPFIKKNIQDYITLDKDEEPKRTFIMNSTATLDIKTLKSIGAEFIEKERKERKPLENLTPLEEKKGFPLISFMAGSNFGNIYHSETDTQNMIDMAIADKVDTVYIQGLIYGTYYHNQTSRRLLADPTYESLDSRLKAAHNVVKRLNDAGIKVVYQMGDEETHLYNDLFKIYVREQGVIGNNFLKREDLRSKYDWVRPIIIEELIPYLIRCGEDVVNLYNDDTKDTQVSKVCHALKLYNEHLPLGDLKKYIKEEYLKDTDMFRVVYSTIDNYDKDDKALSVDMLHNPAFSYNTQYGNPTASINKNVKNFQTGAVSKYDVKDIPQLFVDARQGAMSLSYLGNQVTLNVPQMIDDGTYIAHPELLSGIKEQVLEDPTHKRVTQATTRPNYPGGWTITGDAREIMSIAPYYKRVKEVMDYVQKTGEALPSLNVLHLNDTQIGSPTERIEYMLKMLDMAFYEYNIKGIWGNGDFQQGWNYPKFANESRHMGSMSTSQQMVDFVELERPWIDEAYGVVKPNAFETENNDYRIDNNTSRRIINNLLDKKLLKVQDGAFGDVIAIDKDIDYKTADIKLDGDLEQYNSYVKDKLSNIHLLWFYHLVEGNHEYNSDWNQKGYKLVEHIRQELEKNKTATGGDLEIVLSEYFLNEHGDFVNAPFGRKTINGYNIMYGHKFGVNSGTPTMAMAKYLDRFGCDSNRIDRAFMGHLHIFETAVVNNKLLSITGCSAGQSGYEQSLGYSSHPLFVVDRYKSDGRIVIDTIGTEYLDNYKIKNPYVNKIGLKNFIQQCLTEEAPLYGDKEPEHVNTLYQRKLVPSTPNKIIGPNIR